MPLAINRSSASAAVPTGDGEAGDDSGEESGGEDDEEEKVRGEDEDEDDEQTQLESPVRFLPFHCWVIC